jgi:prepilin-type N-terminal cleavage/methylation domain-containing protein
MSERNKRGMTLIEIMIVMVILFMIITITGGILTKCVDAYKRSDSTAPVFRLAAEGMEVMSRELRMCSRIYSPDEKHLTAGYLPQKDLYSPFIFVRWCPEEARDEVVGYQYDRETHTAVCLTYEPRYNPADPESQVARDRKVVIKSIDNLAFTYSLHLNDEFIQCGFTVVKDDRVNRNIKRGDASLQTSVRIQGGYIE